jgi:hypothetical protein
MPASAFVLVKHALVLDVFRRRVLRTGGDEQMARIALSS